MREAKKIKPPIRTPWKGLTVGGKSLFTFANLSLAFVLLCCAIIGSFEQYEVYFSLAIVVVVALNWKNDEFYLYIGIFMLFTEQFYLREGTTTAYRIYSYLLLLRLLKDVYTLRVQPQYIPIMFIFAVFSFVCTGRLSFRVSMMVLCDVIFVFMTASILHQKPELMRKFTVVFVLAAICTGLYSLQSKSFISYEEGIGAQVTITRYVGTVGDANFAGMYYNVALFMAICSDAFKKWYLRVPAVGALLYFIILTASQTGLLCFLIGLCVYLVLRYRVPSGVVLSMTIAFSALLGVVALLNIPELRNHPALSTLAIRIENSIRELNSGDVVTLTTGRTALWRVSWEYFTQRPLLEKLIGGNAVTMLLTKPELLELMGGAVHQSYVQSLLNFGILGTVVIFGTFAGMTIKKFFQCMRLDESWLPIDMLRCSAMTAFIFMLYASTVDIFMDWRSLFLFFF